jgi:glycerol-3-phosphate cytidylyltransferase
MLEEAKRHCDKLIVGVQVDPTIDRPQKNKPIMSLDERLIMVRSMRWVDAVHTYETEAGLLTLLDIVKPDVRIVGADWKGKQFTGWQLPIRVIFISRDHDYSTSSLRTRVMSVEIEKHATASLMPHMEKIQQYLKNTPT